MMLIEVGLCILLVFFEKLVMVVMYELEVLGICVVMGM